MSRYFCDCCTGELVFQWSDHHGVGVCVRCGLPYRIYHYENDMRVEKPPEMVLTPEGLDLAKRYWVEKRRRVFPATFDIGISRNGYSYSGASPEDCRLFSEWYRVQPEVIAHELAKQGTADRESA